ncbi:transmembrane protein 160-like [Glandiceps talaboti]
MNVNTMSVSKQAYSTSSRSVQKSSQTVTTQDVKKLEEELMAKTQQERALWILRTGHENTYLSWARNAIISCVGGYTMYGQDQIPWNKEAALGLFLLGVTTFTIGSVSFIISSITLRKLIRLSPLFILWNCVHATISLCLFCTAIAIYIGLVAFEPKEQTEKQVSSVQEV